MGNECDQGAVSVPGFYSCAKQVAEHRHVREAWDTAVAVVLLIGIQAAQHADLPVFDTNVGFVDGLSDNRLLNASDVGGGLHVGDLGLDVHSDVIRRVHTRFDFDFHTDIHLLELGGGVRDGPGSGHGGVQRAGDIGNPAADCERGRSAISSTQLWPLQNASRGIR